MSLFIKIKCFSRQICILSQIAFCICSNLAGRQAQDSALSMSSSPIIYFLEPSLDGSHLRAVLCCACSWGGWQGEGGVLAVALLWTGRVQLSRAASRSVILVSVLSHNTTPAVPCTLHWKLNLLLHATLMCPSHPTPQTHSLAFNI